jgi:hypothetical protein
LEEWQYQPAIKDFIISQANGVDYKTQGLAEAILAKVWAIKMVEERLEPIDPKVNGRIGSTLAASDNTSEQIELANGISVYPNPAYNILNLKLEAEPAEAIVINILDVTGKIVATQTCNSNCSINIQHLEAGVYFITLVTQNKTISTKKIVVIK